MKITKCKLIKSNFLNSQSKYLILMFCSSQQVEPWLWPPLQWCPLVVWFCFWSHPQVCFFLLWVSEIKLGLNWIINDEFSEEITWSSSFCLMSSISLTILSLYFLRCWASWFWSLLAFSPPLNIIFICPNQIIETEQLYCDSKLFVTNITIDSWSQQRDVLRVLAE